MLDSPSGFVLTSATGHTIHGTGVVALPLANHGTVSADVAGRRLRLSGWGKSNDGTFEAVNGAELGVQVSPQEYSPSLHWMPLAFGARRDGARSSLLWLTLPERAQVTIDVFDVAGRRVARPVMAPEETGLHEYRWPDGDAAPSGFYLARATVVTPAGTRMLTTRFAVLR